MDSISYDVEVMNHNIVPSPRARRAAHLTTFVDFDEVHLKSECVCVEGEPRRKKSGPRRQIQVRGKLLRRVVKKMIAPKEEEEDVRNEFLQNSIESALDNFDKPSGRLVRKSWSLSQKAVNQSQAGHKIANMLQKMSNNVPSLKSKVHYASQFYDPVQHTQLCESERSERARQRGNDT